MLIYVPLHLIIINLCSGQYITKPLRSLNRNTTVNVWVAGFGWICPGNGTVASFLPVHFWTNFGWWGADEP
jgi:hypothetical protein